MKTKIAKLFRRNGVGQEPNGSFTPGAAAPDFTLLASNGETITLSQFQGRPVVLVFYPADDTPVCSDQLALYNEAKHIFDEYEAQLLAISVDDIESHKKFAESLKLKFPLLADDNPAGEVAGRFGVFDHTDGKSDRALFVVNPEGDIHWREVSPRPVNPGAHGILSALDSLK